MLFANALVSSLFKKNVTYYSAVSLLKIPGKLAAVDATVEQSLAKKFKVQGYPTVKLFHEGEFKFDANVRDVDRILALMRDPTKPPPVPEEEKPWSSVPSEVIHLSTDTFKQVLKKKRHALVMYYAPCKYEVHFKRKS